MRISHDAAEPVGYRFRYGRKKACVCTDLGLYTDYTVECLKDSDVVLLEANHDIRMLEVGPYPWPLKQRILGARGHLSNTSSGELLSRILNDHMKAVFLGHLSKENNLPELAYETVRMELFFHQDRYRAEELPIRVADRQKASPLIEF
jgi:phosphoribosyl 1,2-cyclic phosphodiesterase